MSDDRALLAAIAQPLAAGELPPGAPCEALADRLMLAGAGAAAARWRSWALLPPEPERLLLALGEATFLLCEPVDEGQLAWGPVLAALEQQAAADSLDGLVAAALQTAAGLPGAEVADGLVGRLEQAGADRAALRLVEAMWQEQRRFGLNPPALCNRMGRLWRQLGDPFQAELRFRLSLEQLPEQPLAWFSLARLLLDQGLADRALHAAERGLQLHPGHGWGLKLRVHALRALGGWGSLEVLRRRGLGPADAAMAAALEHDLAAFRRRERRARRLAERSAISASPAVSEEQKRLAAAILDRSGALLLVQARSASPVIGLIRTGLWPADRPVQPVASRDPWRVRQELRQAGAEVGEELGLVEVCQAIRPAAVILARPANRALPIELKLWLEDPSVAWMAPLGLVQPSPEPPDWRGGGWGVWAGAGPGQP
ncbi:MAG: hypothetical protein ACKO8I_19255 [Cyanobacteriota bacterium]